MLINIIYIPLINTINILADMFQISLLHICFHILVYNTLNEKTTLIIFSHAVVS